MPYTMGYGGGLGGVADYSALLAAAGSGSLAAVPEMQSEAAATGKKGKKQSAEKSVDESKLFTKFILTPS